MTLQRAWNILDKAGYKVIYCLGSGVYIAYKLNKRYKAPSVTGLAKKIL